MDDQEARRRFAASPVARLATARPDGAPHIVPVTFALDGDLVYTAVDHKPKRHDRLQRLANLRQQPRCALLVDHYESDWRQLWWVRADGQADIVDEPDPTHPGLVALARRYAPYRNTAPRGPLIIITVGSWVSWAA
ncbi:MAG TPA: TIGR03668 family PPOX class F420-dependent oxidoreductase [Egibacteraceae bacterium]|nr:TIGR03668 family PPOX class F420-dependent oxidoreductase [Egibacteraceae bacterium]